MSAGILRYVIATILALHGIGQFMGVIPALRLSIVRNSNMPILQNWSSHSWLLTPLLGETTSRYICAILWGLPFLGFIAALLAFFNVLVPYEYWRPLAVASAAISLVALLLYWQALVMLVPHKVGNIAVNVAILIVLLVLH